MAANDKTDVDFTTQAVQEVADTRPARLQEKVTFADLLEVHKRAVEIKKRGAGQ
jgi:hypothetical protein